MYMRRHLHLTQMCLVATCLSNRLTASFYLM